VIGIVHLQGRGSVFCDPWPMSALGQKQSLVNVRFAPTADILELGDGVAIFEKEQ